MIEKQTWNPGESEIQLNSGAVRNTWSREERNRRQQFALDRQRWLHSVLFERNVKIPA